MTHGHSAPLPGAVSEDERRSATRKDEDRSRPAWFAGVVLIGLGVIFLLENSGVTITQNWWAAFIYVAAGAAFVNMWRQYAQAGYVDSKSAGSLTGGLLLTTVATIFLFNLEWDMWWPLVLVAIGSGILLGRILGSTTERRSG